MSKTVAAPIEPGHGAIDVAARGWDHDAWGGDFFPLDLPRAWRLTFYANEFRSVLAPGRTLLQVESSHFEQWHGDTPEAFRFYLEIGARLVERFRSGGVAALLRWLEPLSDRVAGLLLLGVPFHREPAFAHWLEALSERFAIYTLTGRAQAAARLTSTSSASAVLRRCWHPGLEIAGQDHRGGLGLMLGCAADLPGLRRQIEAFSVYARQAERATLCFTGRPPSVDHLQQARILVELMGG